MKRKRVGEPTGTSQQEQSPVTVAATDLWDPFQYLNKEPTEMCLSTVRRQILELNDCRPPGSFVVPEEHDITHIHVLVLGPVGTPYDGGFFHFVLKCPADYPSRPPLVRLMTTDSGRVRFNLSVYENGKVCLPLLGTDTGIPSWTRDHSIGSVVTAIRSLLANENPIAEGSAFGVLPALGTWTNSSICYNDVLQHETIRVAVCGTVEDCLSGNSPLPDPLKDEVLKQFSHLYDQYEKAVRERLPMTGCCMNDGYDCVVYQYKTLLTRLQDLRGRVDTMNG
ncbi:hypothetical protein HPB50_028550 [Hyalomma asiaticum]|nr:hypothetical protein HPB50_028550 [Hyalomma asiaticum]